MYSRIFTGKVMHARRTPIEHTFVYPVYFYAFDLDELPQLDREVFGFGYNRQNIAALFDRDYLDEEDTPLRSRLEKFLRSAGVEDSCARVELVTSARYLNYVFNPVSFYYCYNAAGECFCHVAEVNNTFKERHLYILSQNEREKGNGAERYLVDKAFHVSPFNDMEGKYEFFFSDVSDSLDVRLNIVREEGPVFFSRLSGSGRELTSKNLMSVLTRYPLTASLTMPRILWEAGKLHYVKKLQVYTKPGPVSERTIKVAKPKWLERQTMSAVCRALRRIEIGCLELCLPDRSSLFFGSLEDDHRVKLKVKRWRFFRRIVFGGDIALGESYVDNDWEASDLTALMELFARNKRVIAGRHQLLSSLSRLVDRLRHLLRSNSRRGSKKNIRAHYDLSNEFFRLFLDESLTYSSALYADRDEDLHAAQLRKLDHIITQARIRPQDHVLEIGSGWGSFAIRAASRTGCRVTSVTISQEQFELARERVAEAGLSDLVSIELCDYRDIKGSFDKVVSIEMLEAVGEEHFGAFFKTIDSVLRPDGAAVLQVITMPEQNFSAYRKRCDWIQKYIFPGCLLPSLEALQSAIGKNSGLIVDSVENIGPHYAVTLAEWRKRFFAAREHVLSLGFDEEFIRAWDYYFSYCEAGFSTRTLNNLQLVLTPVGNERRSFLLGAEKKTRNLELVRGSSEG